MLPRPSPATARACRGSASPLWAPPAAAAACGRCVVPRQPRLRRPQPSARAGAGAGPQGAGDDADARDRALALTSLAASLGGGLLLSHLGVDDALPAWAQAPSAALGWSYVLAWSISFYPQVIENAQRRSVDGLSADYLVYSILGYAAYTAYTLALHFSPGVQAAYMAVHGGSAPDVPLTDVLFAGHALLVSLFTLYQCWLYGDRGAGSSSGGAAPPLLATSKLCNLTGAAVVAAVVAYSGHIGSTCGLGDCDAWLPMLYLLGFIKVSMTLIKYTPQALLNAQRGSTAGWSVNNVLLDLAGGLLSFTQVGLNAFARADASVITGNPAKLGIALLSCAFDALFLLQHYVWYRQPSSGSGSSADADAGAAAAVPLQQQLRGGPSPSSPRRPARRVVAVATRAARQAGRLLRQQG